AVAFLPSVRHELRTAEVEVDVLLARQVRAPWRVAVRAVVQRAGETIVGWIREQRRIGRRPAEHDRRIHVDAARVSAVEVLPAPVPLSELHDRDAMSELGDADIAKALWVAAENVGVHAVLVIQHEKAPLAALFERKKPHAVVPDADLLLLVGGRRRPRKS